jgi:hypothetical protein
MTAAWGPLTEEGPWVRASGGEGRVGGEETVVVTLAVSESRKRAIEAHTFEAGDVAEGENGKSETRRIGLVSNMLDPHMVGIMIMISRLNAAEQTTLWTLE